MFISNTRTRFHPSVLGVVSDMMICLKTVGQVDSTVLRLLPGLVSVGLKVIERYWDFHVLRNQALSMILTMVRDRSSSLHRELLLDLSGIIMISRVIKTFARELVNDNDENVIDALRILQVLVSKERAVQEVLNSGCISALLTCLNNIKKATKSTVCIFECFRSITSNGSAKFDFVRHDGVSTVSRHLADFLHALSMPQSASEEEMYATAANQCVCTFLEVCNIDVARGQFAAIGMIQILKEFTTIPQTGKTARLHSNTGNYFSLFGFCSM